MPDVILSWNALRLETKILHFMILINDIPTDIKMNSNVFPYSQTPPMISKMVDFTNFNFGRPIRTIY